MVMISVRTCNDDGGDGGDYHTLIACNDVDVDDDDDDDDDDGDDGG